ncbi:hypothetical protein Pve01_01180 [Planomonospora venezuelensis]|nr:hypothetical protein Pve01_01180 [Planomonospora venezuelensis]
MLRFRGGRRYGPALRQFGASTVASILNQVGGDRSRTDISFTKGAGHGPGRRRRPCMPPSTARTAPVVEAASGLAR